MQETLTGRGVWAQISESYVAVEMQKPSQGEGFRSAHVTKVAAKHYANVCMHVCMYVCMYVCLGTYIHTYIHTY